MVGKQILHYKIIEELGRGGMGVVYKAEDTKLKRTVAIKFLPGQIAVNEDECARFKIEAQAAAALNHPNIATIHAIEEVDDEMFIVMEYIDGQELKKIVEAENVQTLSVDHILNYASQIAGGLQAAHEKGVVHRDIKSTNIMVNEKGQVKIMDFGLAKIANAGFQLTKENTTLGTTAYMSPEQARGELVDHRTDIWSFGVLLYEMLTGKLPFRGDYEQAVIYSILNEEPSLAEKRQDIPAPLENIVTMCLTKKPDDRPENFLEVIDELKFLRNESTSFHVSNLKTSRNKTFISNESRKHWFPALTVLLIIILAVTAYFVLLKSDDDLPPMQMTRLTSFPGQEADPAFSPDGKTIAFAWEGPERDNFDIYVKLVDAGDPVRLTESPRQDDFPCWSPDGKYIAFSRSVNGRNDAIYVIPALGGNERLITEYRTKDDGGICWSTDGKYIYFSDETEELGWRIYRVSVESSETEAVTTVPEGQENLLDYYPRISPDGKMLAFARRSPATSADVYFLSFTDNKINRLTSDDTPVKGLSWTPDSRYVIFNSNRDGGPGLWRIALEKGHPEKIAVSGMSLLDPSVSLSGNRMAYYELNVNENIWKVNLKDPSIQQPLVMATQHKRFAQISPDNSQIAYSSDRTGSYEIWVNDLNDEKQNKLTALNSPDNQALSWSPDGKYIVFSRLAMGIGNQLYIVSVNGGRPRALTQNAYAPQWSKDSKTIYFSTQQGMYRMSVDGQEEPELLKEGSMFIGESGDGKYFFTCKNQSGRIWFQDLWRMSSDGGEETLIIKRDNFSRFMFGAWAIAPSGIFYVDSPDGKDLSIYYYDLATTKSKELFAAPNGFAGHLDISSDEKWLIYLKRDQSESDIILIENFR